MVDAQTEGQHWVHAWQSWMRAYFARQPPLSDEEQRALLMTEEEEAAAEAEAKAEAKAEAGGGAQTAKAKRAGGDDQDEENDEDEEEEDDEESPLGPFYPGQFVSALYDRLQQLHCMFDRAFFHAFLNSTQKKLNLFCSRMSCFVACVFLSLVFFSG